MVPRARERAAICSAVNVGVFPVETGGAEVEAEVGTDAGTVDLRVYGGTVLNAKCPIYHATAWMRRPTRRQRFGVEKRKRTIERCSLGLRGDHLDWPQIHHRGQRMRPASKTRVYMGQIALSQSVDWTHEVSLI